MAFKIGSALGSVTSKLIIRLTGKATHKPPSACPCVRANSFYQRYRDVTARIKATSCPSIPPLSLTTLAAMERRKAKEIYNATERANDDAQNRCGRQRVWQSVLLRTARCLVNNVRLSVHVMVKLKYFWWTNYSRIAKKYILCKLMLFVDGIFVYYKGLFS